MTVFSQNFMFFDNPRGGTDQMDKAKAAGFQGGFGNVIDYDPSAWDAHRASARANGMFFGPWGRTGHPPPQGTGFERAKAVKIASTAHLWGNQPYILNNEKEIDNAAGTANLQWEVDLVGDDDCAISTEAGPFGNVDWSIWKKPVLPQIMPPDWGWQGKTKAEIMQRANAHKAQWHALGIKCVWFTFGSFGGMVPGQYELKAPYSLYTADAIGIFGYQAWKPTSSGFVGCVEPPKPEPPQALTPKQIRADVVKLTDPWTKKNPKQGLARITIIDRIAEPFFTDEQWARMAPTIKAVLDQEQDEG